MGSGTEVLAVISEPGLPPLHHRVKRCAGGAASESVIWVGILMRRDHHALISVELGDGSVKSYSILFSPLSCLTFSIKWEGGGDGRC